MDFDFDLDFDFDALGSFEVVLFFLRNIVDRPGRTREVGVVNPHECPLLFLLCMCVCACVRVCACAAAALEESE